MNCLSRQLYTTLLILTAVTALPHASATEVIHNFSRYEVAQMHINRKEYGRAAKEYKRIIRNSPEEYKAFNLLGNLYSNQLNNPKQGLKYLKKAKELNPNNYIIHRDIAKVHEQLGNNNEAIKSFNKARQTTLNSDTSERFYLDQARIYGKLGDKEKTISSLRKNIEGDSNSAVKIYYLGESLFGYGQYKDAVTELQKVHALRPDYKFTTYYLGSCYLHLKDYEKSLHYFKYAIITQPNQAMVHHRYGIVNSWLDNTNERLKGYKRALELEPNNTLYVKDLGNAYFSNGDYDSSVIYLLQTLKMDKSLKKINKKHRIGAKVYIILGDAYLKLDEQKKAKKAYMSATGKWGEKYYLKMASIYEKTNPEKFVKYLNRYIFLEPTDFSTKIRLEKYISTMKNRPDSNN